MLSLKLMLLVTDNTTINISNDKTIAIESGLAKNTTPNVNASAANTIDSYTTNSKIIINGGNYAVYYYGSFSDSGDTNTCLEINGGNLRTLSNLLLADILEKRMATIGLTMSTIAYLLPTP